MANLQTLQMLLEACEKAGRHEQSSILLAVSEALYASDRQFHAFVQDLLRVDAFLEAAHRMVQPPAVWRAYTDNTATVYGASPYNAAAQERFDGFSDIRPLAICAGLLRMKAAPLLKAQAIKARRAGTGTGSVHESAVGEADAPEHPSAASTKASTNSPEVVDSGLGEQAK